MGSMTLGCSLGAIAVGPPPPPPPPQAVSKEATNIGGTSRFQFLFNIARLYDRSCEAILILAALPSLYTVRCVIKPDSIRHEVVWPGASDMPSPTFYSAQAVSEIVKFDKSIIPTALRRTRCSWPKPSLFVLTFTFAICVAKYLIAG